jgi:very-short-patch-repair endonuclease
MVVTGDFMKEYTCPYCDKKLNAGNAYKHTPICSLIYENKDDILSMYASGSSVRGICKQYGYNINSVRLMMQTYGVVMRTSSESSILSHERYRDHYRHTTESKAKLREKRISWMKANPDKTAWRTRNAPSYPEKLFIELCETHLLYDKYDIIREYSVYPYYIDFAFLNAKVAIEIDGSQHWLDKTRIDADMKKDELLKNNGWRIMRFRFNV